MVGIRVGFWGSVEWIGVLVWGGVCVIDSKGFVGDRRGYWVELLGGG